MRLVFYMINSLLMQELMLFTYSHLGMRQWNSQILTLNTYSFSFQKFFSFYRLVKNMSTVKKVDRYTFPPFLQLLEHWVLHWNLLVACWSQTKVVFRALLIDLRICCYKIWCNYWACFKRRICDWKVDDSILF